MLVIGRNSMSLYSLTLTGEELELLHPMLRERFTSDPAIGEVIEVYILKTGGSWGRGWGSPFKKTTLVSKACRKTHIQFTKILQCSLLTIPLMILNQNNQPALQL